MFSHFGRFRRPCDEFLPPTSWAGPGPGAWSSYDSDWRGWWADEPPSHAPVFVLTLHPHEPIEMAGGTTFHFVTDGFEKALELAREAGDGDVDIPGSASAVRDALAAPELDELPAALAHYPGSWVE